MIHSVSRSVRSSTGSLSGANAAGSIVDKFVGIDADWMPAVQAYRPATGPRQGLPYVIELPSKGAQVEGLEMLEFRIAESYVQRYHMLANGHTVRIDGTPSGAIRGWEKLLSPGDEDPNSIEHVAILGEN